jgi:SAM-dependent methyltransferase
MSYDSDDVARYYDVNTRAFLRFGQGRSAGVIHRAVWGPGVGRRKHALHYVHGLLLEQTAALGGADVARALDLGCGTGASLRWLADQGVLHGTGVSNSGLQVELADRQSRRYEERLSFRQADFCRPEETLVDEPVDLAFGIESFVQAPDAPTFFRNAARSLRLGGRLALCDDFLSSDVRTERLDRRQRRWLDDFRAGWRVSSLMTPDQADWLARRTGLELVSEQDLTPHLRLTRLRDRAVALLVWGVRPFARELDLDHPRWLSYFGGHALRRCLQHGLVRYRFRVWRRVR